MSRPGILWRAAAAFDVLRGRSPQTRSYFSAASGDRLSSAWITTCLPPDEEIRSDLRIMRSRARQFARDNPVMERYLQLLDDNVFNDEGEIKMVAKYRDRNDKIDKTLNDEVEGKWSEYCNGPVTLDGKQDFSQYSSIMLRTAATDGELFSRMYRGARYRHGLAHQALDADLLEEAYSRASYGTQNEIRLSVEIDSDGAPVGYWVREMPRYLSSTPTGRAYFVPASDMIHWGRGKRANQTRYYTWVHAAMQELHQISEYVLSELIASRGASSQSFGVEDISAADPGIAAPKGPEGPQRLEVEPGVGLWMPPGKKMVMYDPKHPTDAFPEFIKTAMRRFGGATGFAYSSIANDSSDASYANDRSSALRERSTCIKIQNGWIKGFNRPVVNAWIEQAALTGNLPIQALPGPGMQAPIAWQARRWPWVDPLNEMQAAVLGLRYKQTSPQRLAAERGVTLEDIFEEWRQAEELAAEYGFDLMPPDAADPAAAGVDGSKPSTNGNSARTASGEASAKPARNPKTRVGA